MSFAVRFRIAARKLIYFNSRVVKLGPQYYGCNERQTSCTRKQAKPRQGCPDCEYTIQYNYFVEELTKEIQAAKGVTKKGDKLYPVEYMVERATEIAYIASTEKGKDKQWPVLIANLVSIYRDEKSKKEAIDNYSLRQSMDAAKKSKKKGKGDIDDGDD